MRQKVSGHWDRTPSHRAKVLDELPTARVFLPSYSLELNPAERVFEEVRRRAEGRVYDDLGPNDARPKLPRGAASARREPVMRATTTHSVLHGR